VIEEAPSPLLDPMRRARMGTAAVEAARAVGYTGAGTVEFIVDADRPDEFFFLEMNTRLQVEHPVTEMVTGLDLVDAQLRIAAGEAVAFDPSAIAVNGHAIELRVYAEDPKRFLPSPGAITSWVEPTGEGVRVDAGYAAGTTVTPFYDPLLAKLCVWGATRDEAIARARTAVASFEVVGPKTNLPFFADELLVGEGFVSGHYDTGLIDTMRAGTNAAKASK
jgi:acetyl-CoA carboxylase biotin carboxylase subunit